MTMAAELISIHVFGLMFRSGFIFIPHAFNRFDVVGCEFLADPAYVDIDGAVAYDDIVAPNFLKDLFPCEYLIRLGGQQFEQFEFFPGKIDLFPFFQDDVFFPVDDDIPENDS